MDEQNVGQLAEADETDSLYIAPEEVADPEQETEPEPQKSAAEKFRELLGEMRPQKKQLLAIVEFCRDERSAAEIDQMLEPLMEHRVSIFSPVNMRSLLTEAGALVYDSHDEAPEEQLDEEGNLVLPEAGTPTWRATDECLGVCAAQDPYAELAAALDADAAYLEVYALILDMCAGEGAKISQIEHAVADSGLIEGDKRQAGFFVGKLEDIEALEWRGIWVTTDEGARYLENAAR